MPRMSRALFMWYWLRRTQINSMRETRETKPGISRDRVWRNSSARRLCAGSSCARSLTRILVSKPVICGRSIFESKLASPALCNCLVHLFNRDGLSLPLDKPLQVHNRAGLGLQYVFTFLALDERDSISRLQPEILPDFGRNGDLPLGSNRRSSHGKPSNKSIALFLTFSKEELAVYGPMFRR